MLRRRCSSFAPPSRAALVAVVAAVVLAASGCRVDTDVRITAARDGGGLVAAEVVLDEAATAYLAERDVEVAVDDLRAAGWVVEGPVVDGGRTTIEARKRFDDPDHARTVIAELAGPALRDVELERRAGLFTTRTALAGVVDLGRGIETFSDDELAAAFGGIPLGLPGAALERELGRPAGDAFDVTVRVGVPGARTVVDPELGAATPFAVAGSHVNTGRVLAAATAAVTAAAFVLLLVRDRIGRRHDEEPDLAAG